MTFYMKSAPPETGGGVHMVTIYRHEASISAKPTLRNLSTEERETISNTGRCRKYPLIGYSKKALWSLRKTANSLSLSDAPGTPFSLTLTVQQCPEPSELKKILSNIRASLRRWGCSHWLYAMEWAEHDAAPHIHWLIYAPDEEVLQKVVSHWMNRMRHCAPRLNRQKIEACYDTYGWAMYLAKPEQKYDFKLNAHRSGLCWHGVTLWSYSKSWRLVDPLKIEFTATEAVHVKRTMKKRQVSKVPNGDSSRKKKIEDSLCGELKRNLFYRCERISSDDAYRMVVHAQRLSVWNIDQKERREILNAPDRNPSTGTARNSPFVMLLRRELVKIRSKKRECIW